MNKNNIVISDDTEMFLKEKEFQETLIKLKETEDYDLEFYEFYSNGIFLFDNSELKINDFNVVEAIYNEENIFFLDYIYGKELNKEYKIKKVHKLKNLLAFEKFYYNYKEEIEDNKLIIDVNKYEVLKEYLENNGVKYHNSVPELIAKRIIIDKVDK